MIKYQYYPNGTAIYYNPVTNKICSDYEEENSKTETKTGCMKWYIFIYDSNKSIIAITASGYSVIQTSSNANYIRVSYGTSNSSNIQLEEGDTATEYEPYYIESTGTQYIDTGYVPKTNTKLELDLGFNGEFKDYDTYAGNVAFLGVADTKTKVFYINYGASLNHMGIRRFL